LSHCYWIPEIQKQGVKQFPAIHVDFAFPVLFAFLNLIELNVLDVIPYIYIYTLRLIIIEIDFNGIFLHSFVCAVCVQHLFSTGDLSMLQFISNNSDNVILFYEHHHSISQKQAKECDSRGY